MTNSEYGTSFHLSNDELVGLLDDELPTEQARAAESHVAACSECHQRYSELRRVSSSFDLFVESLRPVHSDLEREGLVHKLDAVNQKQGWFVYKRPLRRLGWTLAIAASLAATVLFYPVSKVNRQVHPASQETLEAMNNSIEIDGERFVPLPYSNPDLPLNASRIVQMQVPISSLAEAGIVVEPIVSRVAAPDRAVLADVLLGLDGQPLGVHVVN